MSSRPLRGEPLLRPLSFTRIPVQSHQGTITHGSLWKANCPVGSSTLSLFGSADSYPPSGDKERCVRDSFLTRGKYGRTLWNLTSTKTLRQTEPGINPEFIQLHNQSDADAVRVLPLISPAGDDGYYTYRSGAAMMIQGREHFPKRSTGQLKVTQAERNERDYDFLSARNLLDGWKAMGEMKYESGDTFLELRNVFGEGVVPAIGSEPIGTIEAYKTHEDVDENLLSNLTFYKPICPDNYVTLSDAVQYDDMGPIDNTKLWCVHRYFVSPGETGNPILSLPDVSNPEMTQNVVVSSIVPATSNGTKSTFFSAKLSTNVTGRPLYVMRKPSVNLVNLPTTTVSMTKPTTTTTTTTATTTPTTTATTTTTPAAPPDIDEVADDVRVFLTGTRNFQKNNLVFKGELVSVGGEMTKTRCQDLCSKNYSCISWSFDAQNKGECYHVLGGISKRVKIVTSPRSVIGFTMYNQDSSSGDCVLPNVIVHVEGEDQLKSSSQSATSVEDCHQTCLSQLQHCLVWEFDGIECKMFSNKFINSHDVYLVHSVLSHVGFGLCSNETSLIYEGNVTNMSMQVYQTPLAQSSYTNSSLETKHSGQLHTRYLKNHLKGLYTIGQTLTSNKNIPGIPILAKGIIGKPLIEPTAARQIYSGENGTVWRFTCPKDYEFLGDVVVPRYVSEFHMKDTHRCVHQSFVAPSAFNRSWTLPNNQKIQTIGSDNTFTVGDNTNSIVTLKEMKPDKRGRLLYNSSQFTVMQVHDSHNPPRKTLNMKTKDSPSLYFISSELPKPWVNGPQQVSLVEQYTDRLAAFRNIQGKGLTEPVGAQLIGKVIGAPHHHGLHDQTQLVNYTFWRLECAPGYNALSDVVKMTDYQPPKLNEHACIHNEFLYKGYLDKPIWYDSSMETDGIHLWKVKKCKESESSFHHWVATPYLESKTPEVHYLRPPYDVGVKDSAPCPRHNPADDELFTNKDSGAQLELRTNWPWRNTFTWNNKANPVSAWEPIDKSGEYFVIGHTAVKGLNEPHSSQAVMARSKLGNALATPHISSYWSIGDFPNNDIANTSLWHIKCPTGYKALGDLAVPAPTQASSLAKSVMLKKRNYKCVLDDFVVPAPVAQHPLWYVNTSEYGRASLWPIEVPEAYLKNNYSFGFFKGADHAERPEKNFSAIKPYQEKKGDTFLLKNTENRSFYLRKTKDMEKNEEIVVPSFTDFTYSFWQPRTTQDGFKRIGQVVTIGTEYDGPSYVVKSEGNSRATAEPIKAEQFSSTWKDPFAIWRVVCPDDYKVLSDFVLPYGEKLDLDSMACLHKDFLTTVRSENFASIEQLALHAASYSSKCQVVPLHFFAVSRTEPMYSIKNGTDQTSCSIGPDLDYEDSFETAGDLHWLACFSMRDVIIRGTPVATFNDLGDPDFENCKLFCQLSGDCLGWSFAIAGLANERCFHVHKNDLLTEINLESSPGAFTDMKTCTVGSMLRTYLGCYPESGHTEFNFVAMEGNATIDSCIEACSRKGYPYAGLQETCRCSTTFGRNGNTNEAFCVNKCQADHMQTCGGPDAISVHATGTPGSDTALCILAGAELVFQSGDEYWTPEKVWTSLPYCQKTCEEKGKALCFVWTYKEGFCLHVPRYALHNQVIQADIVLSSYIGESFIGFGNCSEEPGLMYEELNYITRFVATYRQAGKVILSQPIRIPADSKVAFTTYEPVERSSDGSNFSVGQIGKAPGSTSLEALLLTVSNDTSARHTVDPDFAQIWPVESEYDKDGEELYEGSRFWKMICPPNYRSLGDVSGRGQSPPNKDYKCIYKGLVQEAKIGRKTWSYKDNYNQGNFSVWSVETTSPHNSPKSNFFVVSTDFDKPNRTVYEIKPQLSDISGRWKKSTFKEDLRFEAKLSNQNDVVTTWKQVNGSELPQLLTPEQSKEIIHSNSSLPWISIREPTMVYGDWKVFGQKFLSPTQNKTHGIRVGRLVEDSQLSSFFAIHKAFQQEPQNCCVGLL